ncbi:MAG: undecaprenyl-phosphate 4-deoxy-4-formamido-L-arabinose transferase [Lentisphaerae bacterium RIFOXYB12_FULL_65_16]|nr:MAG: undecaprenyl-phosphate 4-deoxy-4-formamido-L-arabinose transferase [Lentisphaerae bacterium RIFOXYA12_64_32]OGV95098.1 MAG: undecaprenyl-phosphate 4-deoxy-4-formamido-L-arabinose transferase [Lentisphaerae bacterium RIFOXYB12_FULL_65_16]
MTDAADKIQTGPVSFSVVIPVYNEQATLGELVRRCLDACEKTAVPFEILLVDDGSRDESANLINAATAANPGRVVGVLLNRNYGQHAAVMAGLAQSRGDMVITLDADLQNPPEEIPHLVAKIQEGYDVVGSVRMDRQDTLFRRLASAVINKAVQKTTGVMMHDYGCMLRAYRRHVVDAMLECDERSTFIPVLANSFARRTTEVEVRHAERAAGESKYSIWKLISLQFDLLTCMTTLPLRVLTVLGAIISLGGVGFGLLLFVLRLIHGPEWAAQGVFTLFAILFFFVGAQFMALGLLGEYVGRIYHDVRARPRYFVERIVGATALATRPVAPDVHQDR